MDPFGYQVASDQGSNELPVDPRQELKEVLRRLKNRYGRRRVFRVSDVEQVVREVCYGAPPPTIDLTTVDEVIE